MLKAGTVWAKAGQVTVLLGRNGCGQTTLLRSALGLCRLDFGIVRFAEEVYERPRSRHSPAEGCSTFPTGAFVVATYGRLASSGHDQSVRHPLDLESIAWLDIDPLEEAAKRMLANGGGERTGAAAAALLPDRQ